MSASGLSPVVLGVLIGVAIGAAMDNIATGIGIGIALALALQLALKPSGEEDPRSEAPSSPADEQERAGGPDRGG